MVSELTREAVHTVGLLGPDDAYGKDGRDALIGALSKAHIAIVSTGDFHPTDTDVSAAVRTVAAQRPEAVVVFGFPAQAALAANALKEAGHQGKVMLDASAAGDLFLDGTAPDGTTIVFVPTMASDDVIATTPSKAERKQWFETYTSHYGVYQGPSSFAADAVRLIAESVIRAGSTDRAAIRGRMETARVDGLSGPIGMTPVNHSGLMPQAMTVLVARSGRWRLLG
jgi:branched-chain amino acid transport system substrate-binding protein